MVQTGGVRSAGGRDVSRARWREPMSRVTPASKAPPCAPARQPTSKPAVAPAAPTAHDWPRLPRPARLKPDAAGHACGNGAPAQPGKTKGCPAGPFVRGTHGSAAETKVDPASALPAPLSMPAPVQPVPEETPPRLIPAGARTRPQFDEVQLPSSSVIGLQVETSLSSERARVEDRVEARVTRDVMARGRVAIPAGSRVLGSVTLVDRGGKVKERARLGIRFHTLVLADGTEVQLNTEPFYRDGESPPATAPRRSAARRSAARSWVAILGGGKGAVIGGTTGAAGGRPRSWPAIAIPPRWPPAPSSTIRLASPVSIEVERREPQ